MRAFVEANELPAGAAFRRQDALDNDVPELRRRRRHRHQPAARAARPATPTCSSRRPAPRRDDDVGLHAARRRRAEADARARPSRRGGARPRLPARRCRSSRRRSSSPPRVARRCRRRAALARMDARGARRLRGVAASRRRCRARSISASCIAHLRERVPDAIVTNGAGNFTAWVHRFWRFHDYPHRSSRRRAAPWATACRPRSPRSASHPERTVVCFAGDGDFLMSGQELATAMQYELPFVVLVVNNGMYGTIRMHQERHYPGRVVGTDLVNPDFAALRARLRRARRDRERTAQFADGARARARRRAAGARSSCRSTPRRSPRARR